MHIRFCNILWDLSPPYSDKKYTIILESNTARKNSEWGFNKYMLRFKVHKREKFFVSDFEFFTIL
jgi:hypothetical protein